MEIIPQESTSIIRRSRRSNSVPRHLILPWAPTGTRLVPVHYAGLALEAKDASPFGSYVAVPEELFTILHGDLEQRYVENHVFHDFGWEVIPGFGQDRRLSRTLAVPCGRHSLVPPKGVHLLESTPTQVENGEISLPGTGWQSIFDRSDEQLAWKLSDEEIDEEPEIGDGFIFTKLDRFDLGTEGDGPEYWLVHRSYAGVFAFFRELTGGTATITKGGRKYGFVTIDIRGVPRGLHYQLLRRDRSTGDQLYAALMEADINLSSGLELLYLHA